MPVKTYFMDYSSIWSLFSHTRVNTGSSLQETSKLTYLPNFLTEYKSVAITGKYDNLCWGCEEKTRGNKKQNQNTHKKQTKKHNLEYFCFFFGIKLLTAAQAWWGMNLLTCHFCAVSVALPMGSVGWCTSNLVLLSLLPDRNASCALYCI